MACGEGHEPIPRTNENWLLRQREHNQPLLKLDKGRILIAPSWVRLKVDRPEANPDSNAVVVLVLGKEFGLVCPQAQTLRVAIGFVQLCLERFRCVSGSTCVQQAAVNSTAC